MKLVIYEPDLKPIEFSLPDLQAVEKQCHSAKFGDSAFVIFKDDGSVMHSGQCDTMFAEARDELLEQQYFCEICKLESFVSYPQGADFQYVNDHVASDHAMLSRNCAYKNGTARVRVRAEGCSQADWNDVLGKKLVQG